MSRVSRAAGVGSSERRTTRTGGGALPEEEEEDEAVSSYPVPPALRVFIPWDTKGETRHVQQPENAGGTAETRGGAYLFYTDT